MSKNLKIFFLVLIGVLIGIGVYSALLAGNYLKNKGQEPASSIQDEVENFNEEEYGCGYSETIFVDYNKFESIKISSTNWEGNGQIVNIDKDGNYTIKSVKGNVGFETKKGVVSGENYEKLLEFLSFCKLFEMEDEYSGETKTIRSWINYKMEIKVDKQIKNIAFNSEYESVPEHLFEIIDKIEEIVK